MAPPDTIPRIAAVVLVVAACLGAGAALAGVGATPTTERVLVVEHADAGEEILTQSVENGSTVALEYTHSVEKSRVYDGYTVRGDELEMTRMEFESYGWGYPADANVTRENGTFVYDPPGSLEELTVATGEIAGHRLHVDDRTYDLVELADAGSVRIYLEVDTSAEPIL